MGKNSAEDIRSEITKSIMESIEKGNPPWRQPWSYNPNGGLPRNASSKRRYTGINPIILILSSMIKGYDSQQWNTGNSWMQLLGVHIKKGEHATLVTLFKHLPLKDKTTGEVQKTATGKDKIIPLLRTFPVFNAEQMVAPTPEMLLAVPHPFGIVNALLGNKVVKGQKSVKRTEPTSIAELMKIANKFLPAKSIPSSTDSREEIAAAISEGINNRLMEYKVSTKILNKDPDYAPAEEFIAAAIKGTGVKVIHKGSKAFYTRGKDVITMPPKSSFESITDYYQTIMHEWIHATEDEKRVGQKEDHDYAFGELVAEIGACFLLMELGVPQSEKMLPNTQSYVGGWLKKMGGDPKYIFNASSQASKAVDYLLAFVGKNNPVFVESEAEDEEELSQAA